MTRPAKVQRSPTAILTSPYGMGGATAQPAIDDLADVDAPTPADGDTLVWDAGLGLWVPGAPVAGSTAAANMVPPRPIEIPRPIGPPGMELNFVPPSTQAFSDAASPGKATVPARLDHKHGMPANPGAPGSSGIVYPSLKPATPDFDFDTPLSGWTAVNTGGSFAAAGAHAQAIDGSHLFLPFWLQSGFIYQSASNVDQEWICGGLVSSSRITNHFIGIALLDSSNNGMAVIYHTSDNTAALIKIVAGVWDTTTATVITGSPGNFIGTPSRIWFRLTRVTNTWDAYFSMTGVSWEAHAPSTLNNTITVSRRAIGVFTGTSSGMQQLTCDWLDTV